MFHTVGIFSGRTTATSQILRATKMGFSGLSRGGIALLSESRRLEPKRILDNSLFIGSRSFTRTSGGECRPDRDFPLFVRWYRQGKLKLDEPVTRYALDQMNQAVDDLEHGRILGRTIITYT